MKLIKPTLAEYDVYAWEKLRSWLDAGQLGVIADSGDPTTGRRS